MDEYDYDELKGASAKELSDLKKKKAKHKAPKRDKRRPKKK